MFEKEPRKIGQKRLLGLLILNRWSNNTQLLINGGASKHLYYLNYFFKSLKVKILHFC